MLFSSRNKSKLYITRNEFRRDFEYMIICLYVTYITDIMYYIITLIKSLLFQSKLYSTNNYYFVEIIHENWLSKYLQYIPLCYAHSALYTI